MKFKLLFFLFINSNVYSLYFYDITIFVSPSFWEKFKNEFEIKKYFSQTLIDVNNIMMYTEIQFNINNIIIFEKHCDYIEIFKNSTLMIEEFDKFVQKDVFKHLKSDHYSLFTFDSLSSLGIATLGRMCNVDGTSVISIQHEREHMAKVFTHELAHSIGVKHDYMYGDSGCKEFDEVCIMFPFYLPEYAPTKFSIRSIHYIQNWKTKSSCHKFKKNKKATKLIYFSHFIENYNFPTKCVKPKRIFLNKNLNLNYFLNYNYIY